MKHGLEISTSSINLVRFYQLIKKESRIRKGGERI
jgi:hypothetical protein